MEIFNPSAIPVIARTDILVMGAGSAGCSAALAARQTADVDVMLIDRAGFPGGISTQALDTFYGFFTPGDAPKKVVGGIGSQVVDALDAVGAVFLRPNTYGAGTGVNYNPERLKLTWDELLFQAGVNLRLHTTLVAVEQINDRIESVIVHGKQGFGRIQAHTYIDASGDADFCHLAGLPYEQAGENGPVQTMTTTFRMANVDLAAYEQAGGKKNLMKKMAQALEQGTHPLPRKAGSIHPMNVAGCISTVAVRVAGFSGLDAADLTLAEQEGRRQAFLYESFLRDCISGFEQANIIGLSASIGVRESRRVYGEYRLTRDDCLGQARFADRVLICGAPIEDHRASTDGQEETHWAYVPDGGVYEVPFRCFIPKGTDQALVCGRCFSATHDAHASCRSMGQTMAMGHACGTAAALAIQSNTQARNIATDHLQSKLLSQHAILDLPEQAADITPDGWSHN